MELDSFKAILLRKADGNINLLQLLTNIEEDVFVNSVVDALEKMAKPTHLTGINANAPLTSFGANLDRTDMTQLRDALSHHLSHYKAALKAHHAATDEKQKSHLRQVADQHLEHAIPLMHLTARASAHSQGKLGIDYPPLAPWETNYTTLERVPSGRFKRDAKLLRARPSKGAKRDHDLSTSIPDYHYLEMAPHPGHEAVGKMPHKGAYPWEEVQIGSPADIDAKKAYLHIEDVPNKQDYTPHEFDMHPIRGVADIQADHMTPEAMQNFANAHTGWRSSEHHKKWMEGQKTKFTADPEGYKKRGQTKGSHFYDGIPLAESPGHTKKYAEAAAAKAAAATKTTAAAPVAPTKTQVSAAPEVAPHPEINIDALPKSIRHLAPGAPPKGVTIRKQVPVTPAVKPSEPKAAVTPTAPVHPLESAYQALAHVPAQHHETIMNGIPGLREYAATKGGKK